MTFIRLGYVAMSMQLQNASPSQTMTFAQFSRIKDREAAIHKLERIALSNLEHILRILRHNAANDIRFFRLTSKIIPLANHEELLDWDYMQPLTEPLKKIGEYAKEQRMRLDFHPDYFVLLNSPKSDILKNSIRTLRLHHRLLKDMNIDPIHRCVMHVGGSYKETESALERFIHNWMYVPSDLQEMIMLENDDTSFTLMDTLYLCEKLGLPLVFDYHHHLAHHQDADWLSHWNRIVNTWSGSPLPLKMHISSPKSEKEYRHHAEYVDIDLFFKFLNEVKGSVQHIDCMIEAKQKDQALFHLMSQIKERNDVEIVDNASFFLK
jgi:UV DNA damage endonuclease